jgi:transcriptional regulator GlxA family with amidase domain
VGAVLDLCRLANRYTGQLFAGQDGPRVAMRTSLLTRDGGDARFADGRRMRADAPADGAMRYDVVYIASFELDASDCRSTLAGFDADICPWLRHQRDADAKICAARAGILVLAQAGLLDGGLAAEPREHAAFFRRKFSSVRTAGVIAKWSGLHTAGVMAAEPVAIIGALEEAFSTNLRDHLVKLTDIGAESVQADEPASLELSHDDVVRRAQIWLQQRFTQKVTIPELSEAVGVSQKTLTRRFRQALSMSPQAYLHRLRMETARRQLQHTNRSIRRVAALVGYNDVGFFGEKFRQHTGSTPSEFRRTSQRPSGKA